MAWIWGPWLPGCCPLWVVVGAGPTADTEHRPPGLFGWASASYAQSQGVWGSRRRPGSRLGSRSCSGHQGQHRAEALCRRRPGLHLGQVQPLGSLSLKWTLSELGARKHSWVCSLLGWDGGPAVQSGGGKLGLPRHAGRWPLGGGALHLASHWVLHGADPLCSLTGGHRACCKGRRAERGRQEPPRQPFQGPLVWGCSLEPRERLRAQEAGLRGTCSLRRCLGSHSWAAPPAASWPPGRPAPWPLSSGSEPHTLAWGPKRGCECASPGFRLCSHQPWVGLTCS